MMPDPPHPARNGAPTSPQRGEVTLWRNGASLHLSPLGRGRERSERVRGRNSPVAITSALVVLLLIASAFMTSAAFAATRTRQIIRYDSVAIEVITEGQGPAILLLPSVARDSEDYDAVAEGLADAGFRVLRPQPRGIGASTGAMTGISLHDFANDIAEVITSLGNGRAVIVGHAYGNWVARMTAVDHPAQVRGVVIAAAAAKQYPAELTAAINVAGDPSKPAEDRLKALRFAYFAPGNDPSGWLNGWHPDVRDAQRAAVAAVKQSDWWSGGSAPLLDLQAAQDPFKPVEKRNEMKDEFGDRVTIAVIPNASHALFPEQPRAVVEALTAWIKTLPP